MPEQATELPSGHRIGRYLVRRRLGAGGFARVYLAWDPDLEIEVAIKVPKPQLADDVEALERFRREATTAARLRHPNVVTVLTVGRLDEPFDGAPVGAPFLVMDYLPETLSGRLAATPILPEPEWLRIGEEVARGLAYAHTQGVVHRDVKPDNILFGRHGEAVVTDFGIARALSERLAPSSRSIVVGTPEYFSPEQARGLPLDGRTDIYALGVTLFRMATGELPFRGDDWYAIMRQHVEDPAPSPRALNPSLSDTAERAIVQCLAKGPEDRFQTAAELSAALAAAGASARLPLATSPDRATIEMDGSALVPAPPTRSPARRRWLAAAGLTVTAGGAALALLLGRGAATPPPKIEIPPADAAPAPPPATSPTDSVVSIVPPIPAPRESAGTSTVVVNRRGALRVDAPANAVISVDGLPVGSGTWRNDSMALGRHRVTASVPSPDGCGSSTKGEDFTLIPGQVHRSRLRPIPCGTLTLSVTPAVVAHYRFTADRVVAEGNLPSAQPIVLPEGEYRLEIEAPACQPYQSTVRISSSVLTPPKRVKLFCA